MPETTFQNNSSNFGYYRILLLYAILTLFCNCGKDKNQENDCTILLGKDCDNLKSIGIDGSYSFLDDIAWTRFSIYEEKVQACQIPESILSEMCTYDLVKTCLVNYPFLLDFIAYDNMQDGFDSYKKAFNGIPKLINRCDGCVEIIDYYKQLSLSINPDSTFTFQNSWGLYFTEIFLAQSDFFHSLTTAERLNLFQLALKIRGLKLGDVRHGMGSIDTTDWILARIMFYEGYTPFIKMIKNNKSLSCFFNTMHPIDYEDFVEIHTLIYNFSISFLKLKQ